MMGEVPTMDEAIKLADQFVEVNDSRIDDKWGPAGCIKVGKGQFLFFGWAPT